tara:strand:+ start:573 stop:833 length:261 start_codon:yes stop_codon:yes gene_type:complete
MKINNSLDVARWEKLECKCNMNNETECFPFVKCEHCRCQECWNSVPQSDFTVKELDDDKNEVSRTVNEITLVRGHDLQDVVGWTWQ